MPRPRWPSTTASAPRRSPHRSGALAPGPRSDRADDLHRPVPPALPGEPRRPGRAHRGRGHAGTTWSCPPGRPRCCTTSPGRCVTDTGSTRSGASAGRPAAGSGSPRCSRARAAPARPWPPRSSAADLELDLYRIDLSATVSKYIGETEKNLQRLFDAAETSGAVLLFDEADALFGKRGEVKQAHDRYANLEVAYLLGRMETYRGLALLTTNLRGNLDRAFLRRLRFVLQFPFPDEDQRARIWAAHVPARRTDQGPRPPPRWPGWPWRVAPSGRSPSRPRSPPPTTGRRSPRPTSRGPPRSSTPRRTGRSPTPSGRRCDDAAASPGRAPAAAPGRASRSTRSSCAVSPTTRPRRSSPSSRRR